MRKICLAIASLLITLFASAQSFTSADGLFEVSGPYDGPNIHGQVAVRNVSGQALDLTCRISSAEMTPGHTKWFCFGPICYPPNVTVSLITTVNAGDTALLMAYCAPNDSEGVSTIHYEIFDANGNSDTISFTFTYSFLVAGVDELNAGANMLMLSPNPATGFLNVDCKKPIAALSVYNSSGALILHRALNSGMQPLNLSTEAKGIYFIEVVADGKREQRKIILN